MSDKILKECRRAKERLSRPVWGCGCSYGFYDETPREADETGREICRFLTLSQKETGKT